MLLFTGNFVQNIDSSRFIYAIFLKVLVLNMHWCYQKVNCRLMTVKVHFISNMDKRYHGARFNSCWFNMCRFCQMGVTKPNSSFPLFSPFQNHPNTGYLLNITFIFGRCHGSLAAVTSANYECDLETLASTFAKSKISRTEKLTIGALATPTPGRNSWKPTFIVMVN